LELLIKAESNQSEMARILQVDKSIHKLIGTQKAADQLAATSAVAAVCFLVFGPLQII
jgi:hypothetical protein